MRWAATTGHRWSFPALAKVAKRRPDVHFLIYGNARTWCGPNSTNFRRSPPSVQFIHCDVAVRMDDKPSQALRHGRWKSSMWKAIEAVKSGDSDACVLGRQHRRADGDVEILPAHHGRRSSARRSRRSGRTCAARASCSTSAPPSAPMLHQLIDFAFWARRWRAPCSASNGRASACSMSASRRSRARKRSRRRAGCCARPTFPR